MNIKLEPNIHTSSFSTDAPINSMHHHMHANRYGHHLQSGIQNLNSSIPAYLQSQAGIMNPSASSLIKEHLNHKLNLAESNQIENISKLNKNSQNMNSNLSSTNSAIYKTAQSLSPASSSSSSSSSSISNSSMSSLNHNKNYSINPIITVSHQNNDEEEQNESNLENTNCDPTEEDCYYSESLQANENHKNESSEGHNTNTELDEDENINNDQSDLNEDDAENFDDDYDDYSSMTVAKNDSSNKIT